MLVICTEWFSLLGLLNLRPKLLVFALSAVFYPSSASACNGKSAKEAPTARSPKSAVDFSLARSKRFNFLRLEHDQKDCTFLRITSVNRMLVAIAPSTKKSTAQSPRMEICERPTDARSLPSQSNGA